MRRSSLRPDSSGLRPGKHGFDSPRLHHSASLCMPRQRRARFPDFCQTFWRTQPWSERRPQPKWFEYGHGFGKPARRMRVV